MTTYIKNKGIYEPRKGEGYALFNSNAPKQDIEDYLQGRLVQKDSKCRHDFPKPNELGLEMKVEELDDFLRRDDVDPDLKDTIQRESTHATYPEAYRAEMASSKPIPLRDLKYIITARNDETNEDACSKLTTVMNDVYLTFGERKPFAVIILGKDNRGQYLPWDSNINEFYDQSEERKAA